MPRKKSVVRHGRKKQNLEDSGPGEGKLELSAKVGADIPKITGDEFPKVRDDELPQSASEIPDQIPELGDLPILEEKVLREMHLSPKGAIIKIKDKAEFEKDQTMNIQFNSTDEFIEELDLILGTEGGVDRDIVRIGLLEALDESTSDIYMSSTFAAGDDVYELLIHCGRNDSHVTDGTDEYSSMRESMEDSLADKDLSIRSGRIDG